MGGYEGGSCKAASPVLVCPSPGSLVAPQPACKEPRKGWVGTPDLLHFSAFKASIHFGVPKVGICVPQGPRTLIPQTAVV